MLLLCVCMRVWACTYMRVFYTKETYRNILSKRHLCGLVMSSTGRSADIGPGSQGIERKTTVNKSVSSALDIARTALYNQQSEILREIRSLLETADRSEKHGQPVDSYITESLTERKAKLAEIIVARETLYHAEM